VRPAVTTGDVGAALLAMAPRCMPDLLVMGGYGHALPRILLGGVTETVLRQMTLPVLMAH
jgi:nucleotide-binding universal stress UspA family protein